MNMHYEGSLTKEEFKDFVKLASRPVLRKSGFYLDFQMIFLILGLGFIALGVWTLFTTENMGPCIVLSGIGVIIIILSFKFRKIIDRAWDNYQKSDPRREGDITDDHLEIRFSAGNSQVFWTGFKGYGEYSNILVLFQGDTGFPFSSRFFQTEADWQEFKKFISGKFPVTHRVPISAINSGNWFVWLLLIISVVTMIIIAGQK